MQGFQKNYIIDEIDGNRYKVRGENGEVNKKKYKAIELLKVNKVIERVDDSKKRKDETVHKHVTKLQKELGGSYKETLKQVRRIK